MGKPSKTLSKIAASDNRVAEYEFDAGNDCGEHWLHLRYPWTTDVGSVHERTVKDCLAALRGAWKEGSSQ